MGSKYRIFALLHFHVRWIGKHLALSFHRIRKWRWSFSHSLRDHFDPCGKANVLHGNDSGTVQQPKFRQNLGVVSVIKR